jgi:hypothetical protein
VRDVERSQGALELTARIGVMIAGTRPEKAQCVGIDRLRQALAFEGFAEMLEVIPSGVPLNETARDKQARAVINSKQQGLFVRSRPPLVDRTVVLPEFSDVGAAEAPVGALLGCGCGNKVGEVGFDVGFDAGAGSLEVAQPFHLVGDELIVGRALNGQEALEDFKDLKRPLLPPVPSAGGGLIAGLVLEVGRAELIETCATHSQAGGGAGCVQCAGVEIL